MVSWKPDPGRGGLALGLPTSYGLEHGAILERPSMCSAKAGCAVGGDPPGPERARSAIMERPFCEPQPVCLENGSSASPPSLKKNFIISSKVDSISGRYELRLLSSYICVHRAGRPWAEARATPSTPCEQRCQP